MLGNGRVIEGVPEPPHRFLRRRHQGHSLAKNRNQRGQGRLNIVPSMSVRRASRNQDDESLSRKITGGESKRRTGPVRQSPSSDF